MRGKRKAKAEECREKGGFAMGLRGFVVAEESGANTDEGGTFENGLFEIVTHPHRKLRKRNGKFGFERIAEFSEARKVRARHFGSGNDGSHGHESEDFDAGKAEQGFEAFA